jgi:hypothetical protein
MAQGACVHLSAGQHAPSPPALAWSSSLIVSLPSKSYHVLVKYEAAHTPSKTISIVGDHGR